MLSCLNSQINADSSVCDNPLIFSNGNKYKKYVFIFYAAHSKTSWKKSKTFPQNILVTKHLQSTLPYLQNFIYNTYIN